ncbi:hypothetical protein GGI25_001001 [Coemansia spiralis]|uniref:Uncharacterized protein n=2 Tax=Coemansia TaxID=4863 RepID=A0A9W8GBS8_9FUNG|nr:hypothetical protein BX070DRAFT_250407 [Coemansia spiralis]KAJ1986804.1 hypothetical protein EDC05_006154 [Coemansia umbellata]KAJ2621640.1 hypothetical protein GGI26_003976 [Coemansia sp. RSA 1358]KAJ2680112.1 hypothetical protein GGI25_001001 [Coemansia spiralis]
MTSSVINTETVRVAVGQVFTILGGLQTQLDANRGKRAIAIPKHKNKTHNSAFSNYSNQDFLKIVSVAYNDNNNNNSSTSNSTSNNIGDGIGANWYKEYEEKCRELSELATRYMEKCKEYDQLLSKYNKREQHMATKPSVPKQMILPAKIQTFEDFEALEDVMMAPGSGGRGKRRMMSPLQEAQTQITGLKQKVGVISDETPTKRARRNGTGNGSGLPNLLSSPLSSKCRPLLYNKQLEWRKATAASPKTKAEEKSAVATRASNRPALLSSQETQLDFSELLLPNEPAVELCPQSDHESSKNNEDELWKTAIKQETKGEKKVEAWVGKARENMLLRTESTAANNSDDVADSELQRILDAVGDCDECRAFYSVPGLVLPKRDPQSLCAHSKARKSKDSARKSKDGARKPAAASAWAPKSEQKRPKTPDHFWDIDYFPPIRTAGPEMLRKSKQY